MTFSCSDLTCWLSWMPPVHLNRILPLRTLLYHLQQQLLFLTQYPIFTDFILTTLISRNSFLLLNGNSSEPLPLSERPQHWKRGQSWFQFPNPLLLKPRIQWKSSRSLPGQQGSMFWNLLFSVQDSFPPNILWVRVRSEISS